MIKLSFKNPYLVFVMVLVVAVLSAVLIPRMPVDILPQFKKSAMQILTLYPGMPAEVVEKDITSRMERWTGQSPGIQKQLSKSLMGVSIVTNFYGEDVDPAEAMANTSAYAMSDMYYQPPGTLPPMVQPFDPTASKPLMLLTVSSKVKSGKELYGLAYYNLRQMLSRCSSNHGNFRFERVHTLYELRALSYVFFYDTRIQNQSCGICTP